MSDIYLPLDYVSPSRSLVCRDEPKSFKLEYLRATWLDALLSSVNPLNFASTVFQTYCIIAAIMLTSLYLYRYFIVLSLIDFESWLPMQQLRLSAFMCEVGKWLFTFCHGRDVTMELPPDSVSHGTDFDAISKAVFYTLSLVHLILNAASANCLLQTSLVSRHAFVLPSSVGAS